MLDNVHQYPLEADKTLLYLQQNLENTNSLSTKIYQQTPFEKGSFYTLLGEHISPDQLYEFMHGGVGAKIRNAVLDVVKKELQEHPDLICVFDNINGPSYEEALKQGKLLEVDVQCGEEIYSIVTKKTSSDKLLKLCFSYSNACWHSLCVLSKASPIIRENRSITEADLISIAQEAYLVIAGAYDGESFVFWKRKAL